MTARILCGSLCLALSLNSPALSQDRGAECSFRFRNTELRAALDSLLRWYAVPLIYLERDVADKRVTAECESCDLEGALAAVLAGTQLRATTIDGQIVIRPAADDESSRATSYAGTVVDSATGEPVTQATIVLTALPGSSPYRWCATGPSGFFSLRNVLPGEYTLHVRRVGYRPLRERLTVEPGPAVIRDIRLQGRELMQPRVTVEGRRSAFAAAEGISRGVFIRSTPSDHHQYFLEGARIYNPVHFGGLTSAFNGDALHDVQEIAGGVPPYYGGRIGGVLDVALRSGDPEAIAGSVEVGSLGSGLVLEGPVSGTTTYVVSGRQGYPDAFAQAWQPDKAAADLHTSEVMFKLTRSMPGNQRLSATGFFSRDANDRGVTGAGGPGLRLDNALRWRNAAASIRWTGVAEPALFVSTSAAFTDYGFSVRHRWSSPGAPDDRFDSDFALQDLSLRGHAEYFYDEFHTMSAGVELVRHRLSGTISAFSSQILSMSLSAPPPWELSVYVQDQWRLIPSVLAEFGARATSFVAAGGASSSVDPRFSLLVMLDDDRRIFASLSAVNQYLHPYRHSGIFLFFPSIFFYPSDANVPPSTSLLAALGFENLFQEDRYRIAVESYYRVTRNLHEFAADTGRPVLSELSDALLVGEGTSYGAEVTLGKRTGSLTGSVRYTLAWSSNRFAELNNGEPFRPRFDRRHELYATLSYSPVDDWTVGGMCLLASSQFPLFGTHGIEEKTVVHTTDAGLVTRGSYSETIDLDGGRLPGFQRIELRVSYAFKMMGAAWEGTVRLLNGYGLLDPFAWNLSAQADPRLRWRVSFDAPPLLPMYPSLNLRMRF